MSKTALPSVLIVDDSAFMRKLVSELVGSTGEFRLRAEPATGGQILSQPFRFLAGPTIVRWDLGSNTVFVSQP